MMIGGVTLDKDLLWDDEFKFVPIVGKADRTIYGNMVVQSFALTGGQPMTLVGNETTGWQKRSTVQALIALSLVPGAIYSVELPDARSFQVMFRSEESPAVEFQPITIVSAPGSDFWYYGTVKLRII
jgi:hypothetical protein